MAGKKGALSKKNTIEPGTKSTREKIDNSSEIVDGDCDDFVSCTKRVKLSTRAHIVESDEDDELIILN